jgi:hypothetical protein
MFKHLKSSSCPLPPAPLLLLLPAAAAAAAFVLDPPEDAQRGLLWVVLSLVHLASGKLEEGELMGHTAGRAGGSGGLGNVPGVGPGSCLGFPDACAIHCGADRVAAPCLTHYLCTACTAEELYQQLEGLASAASRRTPCLERLGTSLRLSARAGECPEGGRAGGRAASSADAFHIVLGCLSSGCFVAGSVCWRPAACPIPQPAGGCG